MMAMAHPTELLSVAGSGVAVAGADVGAAVGVGVGVGVAGAGLGVTTGIVVGVGVAGTGVGMEIEAPMILASTQFS